ncbi:MAG: methylenetetrahydrofolate reductase C-terminal domain-containing protein [Candidatus Bathyarchaeota archaeon]|nr:MAG: methylenetetrahydrofolate reductase C-terminal domain-containing protein [Candidatus Bathyarchaeota archaeon]
MIITKQKPLEETMDMTEPYSKIFVVGCGKCATVCQTGGEEEVAAMVEELKDKISDFAVVEEPCDLRLTRRDLKAHKETIAGSDAVLVMNCGAGVQTIADYTGRIVLPALDTMFIGSTERIGRFYDRCKACGECILDETGGICPITRCAKSILNGPCGGQVEGKCEVGEYKNDCAWILIWKKLKEQERLDLFAEFRPPRDHGKKALLTEIIF